MDDGPFQRVYAELSSTPDPPSWKTTWAGIAAWCSAAVTALLTIGIVDRTADGSLVIAADTATWPPLVTTALAIIFGIVQAIATQDRKPTYPTLSDVKGDGE